MKPFKPFWGWTRNTSSSPTHGFFSPFFCPKIFPSYLLHLISRSFHSRAWESSQAWVAHSFEETWNTRLEEGGELNVEGMWRGESKRSTSSQMQKWEKKGKLLPFSTFFSSLWFFFLCVFLFFLLLKKKKMPRRKRLKRRGRNMRPEVGAKSEVVERDLEGKLPPFSAFFFFSIVFFFFSSTWE